VTTENVLINVGDETYVKPCQKSIWLRNFILFKMEWYFWQVHSWFLSSHQV